MPGQNKKHIMIVEDSQDLQNLLGQFFESEGYQLSLAANGQEALDLLHTMSSLPSFILLDLMMPVMDGFEFRQHQVADPRLATIPVAVMTADSSPQAKALRLGVQNFVAKPIRDLEDLLNMVTQLSGD